MGSHCHPARPSSVASSVARTPRGTASCSAKTEPYLRPAETEPTLLVASFGPPADCGTTTQAPGTGCLAAVRPEARQA
eukprot:1509606-Prymnesium_polylepis.3